MASFPQEGMAGQTLLLTQALLDLARQAHRFRRCDGIAGGIQGCIFHCARRTLCRQRPICRIKPADQAADGRAHAHHAGRHRHPAAPSFIELGLRGGGIFHELRDLFLRTFPRQIAPCFQRRFARRRQRRSGASGLGQLPDLAPLCQQAHARAQLDPAQRGFNRVTAEEEHRLFELRQALIEFRRDLVCAHVLPGAPETMRHHVQIHWIPGHEEALEHLLVGRIPQHRTSRLIGKRRAVHSLGKVRRRVDLPPVIHFLHRHSFIPPKALRFRHQLLLPFLDPGFPLFWRQGNVRRICDESLQLLLRRPHGCVPAERTAIRQHLRPAHLHQIFCGSPAPAIWAG